MRKDAARNRGLLVAAARDVFARRGLEASLDDVARQAGVGVGTAYRHFGNKYDLAAAVMHEVIAGVVADAERACLDPDPWSALVGFLEGMLVLQTTDRGLREVMMGVRDPQSELEVHDQLEKPVSRLLERCREAGALRDDVVMSDVGCVLMMLCQVADVAADHTPDLWRRYLPILLAGLTPDGPPLVGTPLSDEAFRVASASYQTGRVRGARPTDARDRSGEQVAQ
ncbi:MAG: TetR/AcrR family transcriptional regulator [Jatrophihabitans endophyticus]|nr:TetR/AcrR family transcriptional regulator [Jatrophihabitans endophyticus]